MSPRPLSVCPSSPDETLHWRVSPAEAAAWPRCCSHTGIAIVCRPSVPASRQHGTANTSLAFRKFYCHGVFACSEERERFGSLASVWLRILLKTQDGRFSKQSWNMPAPCVCPCMLGNSGCMLSHRASSLPSSCLWRGHKAFNSQRTQTVIPRVSEQFKW